MWRHKGCLPLAAVAPNPCQMVKQSSSRFSKLQDLIRVLFHVFRCCGPFYEVMLIS